jgi:small subunit ribosomal protein S16
MRIRLALHGLRHNRIFHIVAVNQNLRRNARPTELLGVYNPRLPLGQDHKIIEWSVDRIKYWLGVGAIPSKAVVSLLEMVGVCLPIVIAYYTCNVQGKIIPPNSKYHNPTPNQPKIPPNT